VSVRAESARGVRAALPIAVAYLPVAFAIGAASSRLGFSLLESALWSMTMYSGANQALMLSSITSGVPLLVVTILCIAGSLRHILYGLALRRRISAAPLARIVFAFGLTDEVFATAATAEGSRDQALKGPWLVSLAVTVLVVWILGTALGNAAGDVLQARSPGLAEALDFALPALFSALVWSTVNRSVLKSMALAAALAAGTVLLGRPEFAVPVGALAIFLPDRKPS